ncbi:hypothetical protein B9Z65_1135 [Elsinoe australis]|uniref:Apple domain-containing protein n=1 Tax=Elsinoe australis TaxID=40998 RepID=A0A2P8AIG7_9PEZI|nr:hypothetical protein B9Z65_1135 [Elsinoe australis]
MSHHLGPLSWLQTLAFLLLLQFTHAAVKPVIGLSCQANDATISAIQNSIGNPQDFCTWYNAANRKYSPILGLSSSQVRQACKCIEANPAVLGSTRSRTFKHNGPSSIPGLNALRKTIAKPVPFCKFWLKSPSRKGSPIRSLGSERINQICEDLVGIRSAPSKSKPSITKNTRGQQSTPPSVSRSASSRRSVTISIPTKPSSTRAIAPSSSTFVSASPAPTATLTAMPPPGLDLTKLDNLTPAKAQSLFFAGSADKDNKTSVASVDAAFLYESVVLDHTIYITSVSCSGSSLQIQYNTKDAYLHAKTAWGPTNKIMLVTSSASCGASSESTVFLTSSFTFNDASMTVQAAGAVTQLKDVVSTAEMSFGSGNNVTLAVPSCADLPTNTTMNFPTAPCDSVFDRTLDDKLGYYSGAEADLDSIYKALVPTASNTRRRVFRRAFTPPVPNWVSAINAVASQITALGNEVVTAGQVSASQIAAGLAQAGPQKREGSLKMTFDQKVLGTNLTSRWGRQYLMFSYDSTNGATTAKGTTSSGQIPEPVQLQVYCVGCGVKGQVDFFASFGYTRSGINAASINLNGQLNITAAVGVNATGQYKGQKKGNLVTNTLGGFTIPGFLSIIPNIRLGIDMQLNTKGQGQMLAGISYVLPKAQANLDYFNRTANSLSGWAPRIDQKFQAYGDLGLITKIALPLELRFSVTVFDLSWDKSISIITAPSFQTTSAYTISDKSTIGRGLPDCPGALSYQMYPSLDITGTFADISTFSLYQQVYTDMLRGCLNNASTPANTTTITSSTATTTIAVATTTPLGIMSKATTSARPILTSSTSTTSTSRSSTTSSKSIVSSTSSTATTTTTRTNTPITTTTTITTTNTMTTAFSTPITITTTTTSSTTSSSPAAEPTCGSTYKTADGRSWLIDCQMDYNGPLITRLTTSSMSDCVKACSDFGYNCRSAIWVPGGQADTWCYLKSSYDAGSNALAGLTVLAARPVVPYQGCPAADNSVFQDEAGVAYRVECGIDYPGDDISFNSTVTTFEDCLEACDNKSGCVGASWVHGGSRANNPYCTFKSIMRNSSRTSDSSYSFKVDSVTLLMNTTTSITKQKRDIPSTPPHHNLISTSLQTRDDKNIAMTDITGIFQLLPDADGNLYLSKNYSVSNPAANFALTTGVVYSDAQSRLLLFFPDTMAAYSASRIRLATTSAIPKGSRLLTWVPLGLNNSTVFTAMDTTGRYYFPVACVYSDSDKIKVLLVKNSLGNLSFLEDEKLQHVLTGGVVQNCEPIALSARGVPNLATLNATVT